MKLLILFSFLLSSSFNVDAQNDQVNWGELTGNQGRLIKLLPNQNNEFYALRWVGGRLLGGYQVTHHKNLALINKKKIKIVAENSIANFEGAQVFGGKFVTFLSDKNVNGNHLFLQEYSDDLQETKDPVKLATYSFDQSKKKGGFRTAMSSNKKFLAVIWLISGKRNERDIYGFNIFNTDLELINEGEYPLPFAPQMSTIHSHHISNKGDYFMAITEFEEKSKTSLFKSHLNYKALHIFRINEDGLDDFKIDLNGKRIDAMSMTSDENNVFILTGIYGVMNSPGVEGIFHQRVDLNTGKKLNEGFKEFEESFITQDWSEQAKKKAERKKSRGRGEPQLYDYKMRDITILKDGTIVGTMEQFYVQVRTYSDPRSGTTSQSYQYYYNDIIAFKINQTGKFDWIKKIRKFQVSTNDEGPYSSYHSYIDEGKVKLIFNDHIKNYENGKFIDSEKIAVTSYSRKKNVASLVSIDLNSGDVDRSIFFERAKVNTLIIPKLFKVDYSNNEVLLYSISGRREKIGTLKIKD
tara:strand:+ start:4554 stop:6122 length:1569 start_codon:yes stop_codon:yes gene_type:complete